MRYPLELPLSPSRRMLLLIAAIHLVAAIAFLSSSLPWSIRFPALALIAASLRGAWCAERAKSGRRLRLEESGAFAAGSHGELRPAQLQDGCTDFGWAVWLQWHADRGRGAVMLVPDNLPPGRWRSLRIWLKHKAVVGSPEASPEDASG